MHVVHLEFVCRLKKALYVLKKAPRAWSDKIGQYLVTIGFQISEADFSLYVRKIEKDIMLLVIYVDDLIITGGSDGDILHVSRTVLSQSRSKL